MVVVITVSTTHIYIMTSANTRVCSQHVAQLCSSHFLFSPLHFLFHLGLPITISYPEHQITLVIAECVGDGKERQELETQPLCAPPSMRKALFRSASLLVESAQWKPWGESTQLAGFSSWSGKPSGLSVSEARLAGRASTWLGGRVKDAAERTEISPLY